MTRMPFGWLGESQRLKYCSHDLPALSVSLSFLRYSACDIGVGGVVGLSGGYAYVSFIQYFITYNR